MIGRAKSLVIASVLLSSLASHQRASAQSVPASKRASAVTPHATPVPTATYWYLGVAIGSFATAGVLLGSALTSLSRAEEDCAPKCRGERTNIQITLATADVMALTGITCSALALYSYLKEPDPTFGPATSRSRSRSRLRSARAFDIRAVREGAVAEFVWRF